MDEVKMAAQMGHAYTVGVVGYQTVLVRLGVNGHPIAATKLNPVQARRLSWLLYDASLRSASVPEFRDDAA